MNTYPPPEFKSDGFNCPFCSAYAQMNWTRLSSSPSSSSRIMEVTCAKCQNKAYWYIGHITQPSIMLYPRSSSAAPPHPDMPEEIKKDYNEARDVVDISPRAASALLRLVIEKLCNILAEKEEKINTNIQYLVEQGLPTRIQQALDIVRVTGNEAVHPGVLHPDDIADVAYSLFDLTNTIIEYMITIPRKTEELFNNLPESKIKAIEKRDSKT